MLHAYRAPPEIARPAIRCPVYSLHRASSVLFEKSSSQPAMQGTPRPMARADPRIRGGPDDRCSSIARDPAASVKGRTVYRSSPKNRKSCALCEGLRKSLCVPQARIRFIAALTFYALPCLSCTQSRLRGKKLCTLTACGCIVIFWQPRCGCQDSGQGPGFAMPCGIVAAPPDCAAAMTAAVAV